jgi:hypothetical protein
MPNGPPCSTSSVLCKRADKNPRDLLSSASAGSLRILFATFTIGDRTLTVTISRNSAWRLLTRSGHQQRKHAARATNPVSSRTSTVIPRASPPAVEPVGPAPMRSGHHVPCFGDVSIPSTTMIPAVRARCILALMLRDALDQVGSGPLARPLRRCVRGLTGDVTQEGSDESGRITR